MRFLRGSMRRPYMAWACALHLGLGFSDSVVEVIGQITQPCSLTSSLWKPAKSKNEAEVLP